MVRKGVHAAEMAITTKHYIACSDADARVAESGVLDYGLKGLYSMHFRRDCGYIIRAFSFVLVSILAGLRGGSWISKARGLRMCVIRDQRSSRLSLALCCAFPKENSMGTQKVGGFSSERMLCDVKRWRYVAKN
jgi:hypothetical protein